MTHSDDPEKKSPPQPDLTAAVRDTAYFLWEQDGQPEGRDEHYWHLALEKHLRARAFDVWLEEGRPEGGEGDGEPEGKE